MVTPDGDPGTVNAMQPADILTGAGVVLVIIGIVGAVTTRGPDETPMAVDTATDTVAGTTTDLPTDSGTDAPTDPAPTTAGPTTEHSASIAAFFPSLARAIREGDATFLYDHLHPTVLERYGEAACRDYVAGLQGNIEMEVVDATGPAPWDWELDGASTTVSDVWTVRVARTFTQDDQTTSDETEAHVAIVDGAVRWFTDCGDPL